MTVLFQKLDPAAQLPRRATGGGSRIRSVRLHPAAVGG